MIKHHKSDGKKKRRKNCSSHRLTSHSTVHFGSKMKMYLKDKIGFCFLRQNNVMFVIDYFRYFFFFSLFVECFSLKQSHPEIASQNGKNIVHSFFS